MNDSSNVIVISFAEIVQLPYLGSAVILLKKWGKLTALIKDGNKAHSPLYWY